VDAKDKIDRFYFPNNILKSVVKEIKKQRLLPDTHGIKLLYDNARAHDAPDVEDYLKQEGIKQMPHPPYSPDFSHCDFWLNDFIKGNLTDQN